MASFDPEEAAGPEPHPGAGLAARGSVHPPAILLLGSFALYLILAAGLVVTLYSRPVLVTALRAADPAGQPAAADAPPVSEAARPFEAAASGFVDALHGVIHAAAEIALTIAIASLAYLSWRGRSTRRKLEAALQRRSQLQNALIELSHEITATLEVSPLLDAVVRLTAEFIDVTSAYISDWDEEAGTYTVIAEYISPQACKLERVSDMHVQYRIEEDLEREREWMRDPTGYIIAHVDDPELHAAERAHMAQYGAQTVLQVPIVAVGKPVGELELWESRRKRNFTCAEIEFVQSVTDQVSKAIGNARLYEALRESERRYRRLVEGMSEAVLQVDNQGTIELVNDRFCEMFGFEREELVGQPANQILQAEESPAALGPPELLAGRPRFDRREMRVRTKSGEPMWLEYGAAPMRDSRGQTIGAVEIYTDITERKRAEQALRESEERFHLLSDAAFEGIAITENGVLLDSNEQLAMMLGYQIPEIIGRNVLDFVAPESRSLVLEHLTAGYEQPYEHLALRRDGVTLPVEVQGRSVPYDGRIIRVTAIRDISDRKEAAEQIQRQVERLAALLAIDNSIATSADLPTTLGVILQHVAAQLQVDACDLLLFRPKVQMLEFAARRGFWTEALQNTYMRLSDGYAGRAVLERRVIHVPNLPDALGGFKRSPLLRVERFVTYFGAPLIAKGNIKGVLEIFHRAPLHPDAEWHTFLDALTARAAIAIDNALLFDDLQRSNVELNLAYETTLEGWAKALELRDKETEGHSQSVTRLTVRLARSIGMSEQELVHVRHGALLHDIGKMAVPDSILLKPGPLNDAEWAIMHEHPVYAYKMLQSITYLQRALDIPYCHHEKWDGSGYPRGLQADEIPLAARIFAVVDVWDALRSDRPYRKAWSDDRALDYICEQAGSHFDPEVVAAFLELIGQPSEVPPLGEGVV